MILIRGYLFLFFFIQTKQFNNIQLFFKELNIYLLLAKLNYFISYTFIHLVNNYTYTRNCTNNFTR